MLICTNYEYDLRRHKRKVELDGTIYTEAEGFTFYLSNGKGPYDPIVMYKGTEYYYLYDSENNLYVSTNPDSYVGGKMIEQENGIADLSGYEYNKDGLSWMDFKIKIPAGDIDGIDEDYEFTYSAAKTTREPATLYSSSAVADDNSYGINTSPDDAVYILRLNIDNDHLDKSLDDGYGYFYGKIGAEMISNGGGLITYIFPVTLKKELQL